MAPAASAARTIVNVVPSIVRVLVHVNGATFTSLLPPQLGRAPAVPLVANATPAVTVPVASSAPAQNRTRARARGVVGMSAAQSSLVIPPGGASECRGDRRPARAAALGVRAP